MQREDNQYRRKVSLPVAFSTAGKPLSTRPAPNRLLLQDRCPGLQGPGSSSAPADSPLGFTAALFCLQGRPCVSEHPRTCTHAHPSWRHFLSTTTPSATNSIQNESGAQSLSALAVTSWPKVLVKQLGNPGRPVQLTGTRPSARAQEITLNELQFLPRFIVCPRQGSVGLGKLL